MSEEIDAAITERAQMMQKYTGWLNEWVRGLIVKHKPVATESSDYRWEVFTDEEPPKYVLTFCSRDVDLAGLIGLPEQEQKARLRELFAACFNQPGLVT
jgi:hypothetical protein